MQFGEGGSLAQFLPVGGFPEPLAQALATQLFSAVKFVHGTGRTHGDIRPEHLLLDRRGNLLLSDFGLSQRHRRDGHQILICYNGAAAQYAPPEV